MDGVEIALAVEDHFGVFMLDDEAEIMQSVGDLVAFIHSRIQAGDSPCLSATAFRKIRQLIGKYINRPIRIRPSDRIEDALDKAEIRVLWKRLVLHGVPSLKFLHRRTTIAFYAAAFALSTIAICFMIYALSKYAWAAFGVIMGVILIPVILLTVKDRLQTELPPEIQTFADLVEYLIPMVAATRHLDLETPEEILDELKPIISEQLAVKESQVTMEARFIEDLGVG